MESSRTCAETASGRRVLRADAERNRQLILNTAAEMFAEHGMRLTLEQIAKAAGIGVGTIYRRFPTLDALIDELFGERIRWWADHVTKLADLAVTEPWESFRQYVLCLAEAHDCDAAYAQLLIEPVTGSPRFRDDHARSLRGARLLLARAREQGAVRGDLHDADLLHIQLAILGVVGASRSLGTQAAARFATLTLEACRGPKAPNDIARLPAPSGDELQLLEALSGADSDTLGTAGESAPSGGEGRQLG
ncbi:TetR/AcrR family transcriptional regulator [Actinomadura verrucosospora]|uniref:Tetr family transcriptional regulator n=1 Tax=Actinomadura verrucosospora TaxID=46165 RepID=A0A7D3W1V6_ACTVE|nr:TetR/AcrR family transcriptional regulator [Actinomadura verrucosospora]QKG27138.1 tetr family transcriptional regulator [Actinomadura verrucosospora]